MVLMEERIWMQILIQKSSSKNAKLKYHKSFSGFTFLEVLVAITLVVLLIGITTPQFFTLFSKTHEVEYKHIKSVLKMLRNDAILKSTSYCLHFDLKKQKMMVSTEDLKGKCNKDFLEEPNVLKAHFFSEELILREAKHAESNYLNSDDNSDFLEVHINSSGFVTPFYLKFSLPNSSNYWQIVSRGIMGKLELIER